MSEKENGRCFKVLLLYYSYSSQTRNLMLAFADGLAQGGVTVSWFQLKPQVNLIFPLGSILATVKMMVLTFFRQRVPIEQPLPELTEDCDVIVLAGPTWSYNPSGPVLSLLDNYGHLFEGKVVLPFISCRGYWRIHYWQLRYMLARRGAEVIAPLIFRHLGPEPWRTIGVFLKLAGKNPESGRSLIKKYYRKFGHTRGQLEIARRLGGDYAKALLSGDNRFLQRRRLIGEVVGEKRSGA